ncbi:MAG TPA: chemotaxis protein CheW [Ktedonobacterales bacterium]|nr:chemotaxis protein CheW [Ktedonobacterales bacterium]
MSDLRDDGASGEPGQNGTNATLRDALRALASSGGGVAGAGLSPQMIADLARSAGLTGLTQSSEFARLFEGGAGAFSTGPTGPQHVVVAIGGVECAIPAEAVQGIERIADVTPVPNTIGWVLGVMQFRGGMVSAVDLVDFLGVPAQGRGGATRLLVLSQDGMTIAFAVDAVLEMRADSDAMRESPAARAPDWLAPYAAGALELGGRTLVRLDVRRLLGAERLHQYRSEL